MKGLAFDVHEWSHAPAHGFDATYSYPPDHPLYSPQGDVFIGRCNDVYRASAMSHDDGNVTLIMQHLRVSDPPYTAASAPGRLITMTPDEFSRYVDALVNMREKMKATKR